MYRISIVAFLAIVTCALDGKTRHSTISHSGFVRDFVTGKDLPGVRVVAFNSSTAATDLDCMFNDTSLGTATSSPHGTFTIQIDSAPHDFVVRYCAEGYITRIEPSNDNDMGAPIRPEPVYLIKHETNSKMMKQALQEIQSYVKARIAELVVQNRYTFQHSANALPETTRLLIGGSYMATGRSGSGRWDSAVARNVWRLSADLLDNLDYLRSTAPADFCQAAKSIPEFDDFVHSECRDLP